MRQLNSVVRALSLGLATPVAVLAQEEHAAGAGNDLFSVDFGLMVWTLIVFGLLLFVLGRYAWKPLLGALDAREQGIRASIDEANRLRDESRELAEEHRAQLAEARREAQSIVAESRDAAERLRRDIEEKARVEGQAIVERARKAIDQEKTAAIEELRRESVELALGAAAKLIGRNLDAEADRTLVSGYLQSLGNRSESEA